MEGVKKKKTQFNSISLAKLYDQQLSYNVDI